jgi:dipeptidyl aminopeptidase/acylaminoacyl peptidase
MKQRWILPALCAGMAWCGVTFSAGAAQAPPPAPARVEAGTLIYDGIPAATGDDAAGLGRWLESRSASFLDWQADGSLITTTRFANVAQLHRVRAPLGMREQLTWSSEPITSVWSHPYDANVLLFGRDKGGDENRQIWLRNLAAGEERLLTDGKSRHGAPVFAHDGRRIAFPGNARDGASTDIYVTDVETGGVPRLVLGGGSEAISVEDWSSDDKRIVFIRYRSAADSELVVVDVATGAQSRLEPLPPPPAPVSRRKSRDARAAETIPGPTSVAQARYSKDGRGIYILSDRGGEFIELRYRDLYTGVELSLTPDARWDVERFDQSPDGQYIAYTQNEAGVDRLVLYATATKANVLLPPLPAGSVIQNIGFDRASHQLAVSLESAQSPRDVYVYTLGAGTPLPQVQLARWTQSELGPIDKSKPVAALPIQFPTWDTVGGSPRLLSGFLYRPATPGPHPVLIYIHGGPESQYRPRWDAFTQYLVNELGYAVVAPNVRGSSGYGRSFLRLDDGRLREDAVRDIGSLLVWLGLQPDIDRSRMVVMGASYGGYMTLASLVNYGERLAGGIDVVGISNFVSFLTNTASYRRDLRRVEYGDERNAEMRLFLQGISPLNNAAAIKKPLLVVQGLNDPRVPASESEQLVSRMRGNGGEVWYLAARDEGHGFRKKTNVDAYLLTVAQFLRRLNTK